MVFGFELTELIKKTKIQHNKTDKFQTSFNKSKLWYVVSLNVESCVNRSVYIRKKNAFYGIGQQPTKNLSVVMTLFCSPAGRHELSYNATGK